MVTLAAGLVLSLSIGGASKWEERALIKSRVFLVKQPSFLGARSSRTLDRGEKLLVEVPGKGSWHLAKADKEQGYVHFSYLSRPPGEYRVSGALSKAESTVSGEYMLAVGGFVPAVESDWRKENPNVEEGFRRLESFMPLLPEEGASRTPDLEALAAFVTEGGLRAPEPRQEAGK